MKPHKKIFEKISLFRWIVITVVPIIVIFQIYSLTSYYNYWSKILSNSYSDALSTTISKYRTLKFNESKGGEMTIEFENEEEEGDDELEVELNGKFFPKKTEKKQDTLGMDKILYNVNSMFLSSMPFEIVTFDSIFFNEIQHREIISEYEICIYNHKNDSILSRTNNLTELNTIYQTQREEVDSLRDVIVYFENPARLIFQKMLLFLIFSILILAIIIALLIYQMKIIDRQKRIEKIRRDFTDSMTHELRHPLQGALSMAEAMENPAFTENADRRTNAVQRIKHNLFNLSNLLESIVQKSYSEKLQQVAEWRDNNLKEMLNDLVVNFTILAKKKIVFVTHFEDIAPTYQYDTVHFPNAIKNLIDNAIKYSDESVTITISVEDNDENFTVTVADNGIGISDKELPYIFDKFYRVYGKKRDHGFGLGLSYVKWVADIHSGSVNVESHKGKGSVFSITIPKAK